MGKAIAKVYRALQDRVGIVAYRLALPPSLSSVHAVFHVSMLRKYTPDPTHVVDWGELAVDADGTFEEGLMCCGSTEEWKRQHGSTKTLFVPLIPSSSRKKVCF